MSSISLRRCTMELPQEAVEGEEIYPPFNPSFIICSSIIPVLRLLISLELSKLSFPKGKNSLTNIFNICICFP